ncbi:MAG: alpha/beta hydrolase [Prevotellaceae bacterium]|jgi:pimeloyl-ACP methyl ester carboxylesterase|nr:alpha/beta hydrolase [Prevotellaceae bacterium]
MKNIILFILLIFSSLLLAQEENFVLHTATGDIYGTLTLSQTSKQTPLVLLIAGSGPTDRNCNQPQMQTNAFKMLSDSLLNHNIATLRFDKRGIAESKKAGSKEIDLRFEHYINDVKSFIDTLAKDKRFSQIIVAGHSEGALIGLVAAENNAKVAKYISISGVAISADEIIKEQISAQPQAVKDMVFPMLDSLKIGKTVENVPQMLYSLFRPSVQPYMISWLKYNPQDEIKKLNIPILIIQGTTDIQVSENQADLLHSANPKSTLCKVENMNHVLKTCAVTEQTAQLATYANPDLPLMEGFVKCIVDFISQF